jgi:serine/threonine protein kinase
MGDNRRGPNSNDPSTANLPHNSLQPLAPGTLMCGRYRVVSRLGKGGMGCVYIVQDEHFEARPLRSMKEMIPRLDDRQQHQYQQRRQRMVSFKREADVLETLRHPNIPRVYDSFTEFRRAYLVLDYIEGEDLEQVLDRTNGFLSPQVVGSWMIQLCRIVEYLHYHKPPIIFRDLKPSNVILTPDQRIILIDFGIAKVFLADEQQTNVGTQGYAAREQYAGEAEIRSDIYAFGSMMHHLLTKTDPRFHLPFSFRERSPRTINPSMSEELERVIMRCLEDDRSKRYQSVSALREALEDALHLSDTSTIHPLMPVRPTPAAAKTNVLGLDAAGAVWDVPTIVLPRDAVSARSADSADGASAGRASSVSSTSTVLSALPTPTASPRPSDPAAPNQPPVLPPPPTKNRDS